jgi:hypothetical protein
VDDAAQTGSRANYTYDASGWIQAVYGARAETIEYDDEGNATSVLP